MRSFDPSIHATLTLSQQQVLVCDTHAQPRLLAKQLPTRVAQLVACMHAYPKTRWIVQAEHLEDFLVAFLAIIQMKSTVVLLPNYQPETIRAQLNDKTALLTDNPVIEKLCVSRDQEVCTFPNWSQQDSSDDEIKVALPAQEQMILELYTSGSSGQPKVIQKTWGQLARELNQLEMLWGQMCGSRTVASTVPHHHIYGLLFRVLWPLYASRTTLSKLAATPVELGEAIRACGQLILVSSPAHLSRMPDLFSIQDWECAFTVVFSSGAPLSEATAKTLSAAWSVPIYEIYGSTETGGIGWRSAQNNQYPDYPYWQLFAGLRLECEGQDSFSGWRLHSPYLPPGQTFLLSDRLEISPDGHFLLQGRADRIVKIEGKRVSLAHMEQLLAEHPCVAEGVLVELQGVRNHLGVVVKLERHAARHLYTAATSDQQRMIRRQLTQQLKDYLRSHLDAVVIPRKWRYVETMPVDARGKLTQQNLQQLFN